MANVQYWNNTLTDEIQHTQQLLQLAGRLSDIGKVSALSRAEKRLRAAHRARKAYISETYLIRNSEERRVEREKLSRLSKDLVVCKNELTSLIEALSSKYSSDLTRDETGNAALQERQDIKDKMNAHDGHTSTKQLFHEQEEIGTTRKVASRVEDDLNTSGCFIKKLWKRMNGHGKNQIHLAESCV